MPPELQAFRKQPITWDGAALGGCIYVAIGGWLLWTTQWPVLAWISLISGIISLYAACDLWRNKKQ
jgi:hypothetical protein